MRITSPARGSFAGDTKTVRVEGTATDDVGVTAVEVNGVAAALAADGAWSATIAVAPGTQLLHAVARDAHGNLGKESRAVVTGPLVAIDREVPQAITAAISAATFDAIGRGISGYLRSGELAAIVAPQNPVVDTGGGPDCLYAQASITRIAVGEATTVSMLPTAAGLVLAIELSRVDVGLGLRYAVACIDGGRDAAIGADRIRITGTLVLGVEAGAFDVRLVDQRVEVTGFRLALGGVPGEIIDLLDLDAGVLGPIIGWAAERLVVPLVNRELDGLNRTQTIDVLGTLVDLIVAPARIALDDRGARIDLDTVLRARGDDAAPGYVYVPNQLPDMAGGRGFALAVADDAVNQLLTSVWAAGGLHRAFALDTGSYGELGKLYDRVELSAAVPPFISAHGSALGSAHGSALTLTIGDLVATFRAGDAIATQVAVSAEIAVRVTTAADGALRLDVGAPTTYVDIVEEGVTGANPLSNVQFELVASFALARVISVGSGAIGAIPLPALGGVAIRNLAITERTGYLIVDGEID